MALISGRTDRRSAGDAGAGHTGVAGGAGVVVAASGAIRHRRRAARAGSGIAHAIDMTLIDGRTGARGARGASAAQTLVSGRAGVAVATGGSVVGLYVGAKERCRGVAQVDRARIVVVTG